MPKLIIIRGPSGSGKSSVSKALLNTCENPTLLIHEDDIRHMFNDWKRPNHTASKELSLASILSGLRGGYDVIYEGISDISKYDIYFQQIFKVHPDENYFFFLDVSFEEAIKRHETRTIKSEFGVAEMKEWLKYATPTGYMKETIIPELSTIDETVATIRKVANFNH